MIERQRLLETKVTDITLPKRVLTCLRIGGIETLGELVQFTLIELYQSLPNFGKNSLTHIQEMLRQRGLSLAVDSPQGKLMDHVAGRIIEIEGKKYKLTEI